VDRQGDFIGCCLHRVVGEMGVSAGRLDVRVAKNGTDYWERVTAGQPDGRKAMAKIMQP
jgi:hypothetical protein